MSNSLLESLHYWSNYCENLYSNVKSKVFNYNNPVEDENLDFPLRYEEFISVCKSLKNNKAPGSDFLTNEDFKNLLSLDDPEILGSTDILKKVFEVISSFWGLERVPLKVKEVILRPFIKDSTKDEHDPTNYRTISLLNTLLKIYEGIIHQRLADFLERKHWFSPY